jgi:uncharacterized protein YegJ (DUF2314 family)
MFYYGETTPAERFLRMRVRNRRRTLLSDGCSAHWPARFALATSLAASLGLAGCEQEAEQSSATAVVTADSQMAEAMNTGRKTFPAFLRAYESPEPGWGNFQVRHAYQTENGYVDHIWLDLQSVQDDGQLECIVPEDEDERAIRFDPGEEIIAEPGTINDWLFIDSRGVFYGGYTMRVTMDRMGNTSGDAENDIHGGIQFRDLDGSLPDAPSTP